MKHAIFLLLFFVFTTVWSQSTTNVGNGGESNCSPVNCQALCNPGCIANTTCVLGTMKVCGVCPSSLCIDNVLLGLPMDPGGGSGGNNGDDGTTTATNSGDSVGMIGGMIGGLVGGGLLLVTVGLIFIYWHKKQNSSKTMSIPPLKINTTSPSSMSNTGVPSTLVAPIPMSHHQKNHTLQGYLHQPLPTNRHDNDMDDDIDDDGRSSVSSVSHHGLASMVTVGGQRQQGFPGARLKPQIMRLSTVRASLVNANLDGTTSVRTMLTPTTIPLSKSAQGSTNNHNSISTNISSSTVSPPFSTIRKTSSDPSLKTETTGNPFDDQHCVIDR